MKRVWMLLRKTPLHPNELNGLILQRVDIVLEEKKENCCVFLGKKQYYSLDTVGKFSMSLLLEIPVQLPSKSIASNSAIAH